MQTKKTVKEDEIEIKQDLSTTQLSPNDELPAQPSLQIQHKSSILLEETTKFEKIVFTIYKKYVFSINII